MFTRARTTRAITVAILGIAAAAAAASAGASDEADKDKAAITAAEERMCGMTNMSQRIEDTIGFYDKDVIQFDIMPEVFQGQDAVRKSLAAQYGNVKNLKCQMHHLQVGVDGNLGYAFSVQSFQAEGVRGGPYANAKLHDDVQAREDSVTVKMTWRQTDIWKKKDGKWTMIHQHSSFPVDTKTGKAVFSPEG
ncbi:MAG: hypothetical protein ABW034_12875 [Steroidobacteraceae bacterium]